MLKDFIINYLKIDDLDEEFDDYEEYVDEVSDEDDYIELIGPSVFNYHLLNIEEDEEYAELLEQEEENSYLESVVEEIRCKRARKIVRKELKEHIKDQQEAFIKKGKEDKEAMQLAIKEMGDPKLVGEQLDKIHRPKTEYGIILLAIALSVFGIIVQSKIFPGIENEYITERYLGRTILYNIIGVMTMLVFFFVDYRLIAKYTGWCYTAYVIFAVLLSLNNKSYHMMLIGANLLWTLYTPIFAGILYRLRNQKVAGYFKAIGMLLLNTIIVFAIFGIGSSSVWFMVQMACGITLLVATLSGHFGLTTKGKVGVLVGTAVPCIALIPITLLNMQEYQYYRLYAILHPFDFEYGVAYTLVNAKRIVNGAVQGANMGNDICKLLPSAYSDYVITSTFGYFGMAVAVLVMVGIVLLLARCLYVISKQANPFGFILGVAVCSLMIIKSLIYILVNLGLFPGTTVDLPFLSFGRNTTILNYMFLGLILSIYRYQNVYGSHMPTIIRTKLKVKMDVTEEKI